MHDYESPTEVMKRCGVYLGVTMPDSKVKLIAHLRGIEACRFDLVKAITEWHRLVAEHRNRMLHPKDKELTELDRNTMLEAHVAVVRQDYEFLVKLDELIVDRIALGRQLLTLL